MGQDFPMMHFKAELALSVVATVTGVTVFLRLNAVVYIS